MPYILSFLYLDGQLHKIGVYIFHWATVTSDQCCKSASVDLLDSCTLEKDMKKLCPSAINVYIKKCELTVRKHAG